MKEKTSQSEHVKLEGGGKYRNALGQSGLFAGNFPSRLAEEWEADCVKNFNGVRWQKMWSDHCTSRVRMMEEAIQEGEEQQEEEAEEQQEENNGILTLGGGVHMKGDE